MITAPMMATMSDPMKVTGPLPANSEKSQPPSQPPRMPTMIAPIAPPGVRPGTIRLAIPPAIAPRINQPMIVPIIPSASFDLHQPDHVTPTRVGQGCTMQTACHDDLPTVRKREQQPPAAGGGRARGKRAE